MARKQRVGFAVADAAHKTVVVRVERTVRHPLYKKTMRRRKRYLAHDEANDCRNGDRVLIEECRPLSRRKSWRVVEILERREVAEIQPGEIAAPAIEPEEPAQEAAPPAASQPEQTAQVEAAVQPAPQAEPPQQVAPPAAPQPEQTAQAEAAAQPAPQVEQTSQTEAAAQPAPQPAADPAAQAETPPTAPPTDREGSA